MKCFLIVAYLSFSFLGAKDIYNLNSFPMLKSVLHSKKYIFILDHKNTNESFLNRFRVMKNLSVSGSSQFNYFGWHALREKLRQYKPLEKVYIVDLREEPHFFIADKSVTIAKKNNKINEHKFFPFLNIKYDKMLLMEEEIVRHVQKKHKHYIYEVINKKQQEHRPHCLITDDVFTERQLVQNSGAHYLRFSITDHKRPTDEQVDAFLALLKEIPHDAWLHFHCRGGVGRSSTFILMFDIIQNGKSKTLDELVERNIKNGASKSLFSPNPCKKEKFADANRRKAFLIDFYKFINDVNGYGKTRWSEWVKKIKA